MKDHEITRAEIDQAFKQWEAVSINLEFGYATNLGVVSLHATAVEADGEKPSLLRLSIEPQGRAILPETLYDADTAELPPGWEDEEEEGDESSPSPAGKENPDSGVREHRLAQTRTYIPSDVLAGWQFRIKTATDEEILETNERGVAILTGFIGDLSEKVTLSYASPKDPVELRTLSSAGNWIQTTTIGIGLSLVLLIAFSLNQYQPDTIAVLPETGVTLVADAIAYVTPIEASNVKGDGPIITRTDPTVFQDVDPIPSRYVWLLDIQESVHLVACQHNDKPDAESLKPILYTRKLIDNNWLTGEARPNYEFFVLIYANSPLPGLPENCDDKPNSISSLLTQDQISNMQDQLLFEPEEQQRSGVEGIVREALAKKFGTTEFLARVVPVYVVSESESR